MILARLLTPADFGIVSMVTTFSLLFRSFGLNGFTELIIQREELTHSLASNLFWIELGIGTILTVAFAGLGPLLALFYHNSAVARSCGGYVADDWDWMPGVDSHGAVTARHALQDYCNHQFRGQWFLVIVAIVLAVAGWHYWAMVWGSVAQTLAMAAGAWLMCRWIPSRPRRASGTGAGLKFAMSVYSHFAFGYSTRNTDNLLVGWRYGARVTWILQESLRLVRIAANAIVVADVRRGR